MALNMLKRNFVNMDSVNNFNSIKKNEMSAEIEDLQKKLAFQNFRKSMSNLRKSKLLTECSKEIKSVPKNDYALKKISVNKLLDKINALNEEGFKEEVKIFRNRGFVTSKGNLKKAELNKMGFLKEKNFIKEYEKLHKESLSSKKMSRIVEEIENSKLRLNTLRSHSIVELINLDYVDKISEIEKIIDKHNNSILQFSNEIENLENRLTMENEPIEIGNIEIKCKDLTARAFFNVPYNPA